MPVYLCYPGGNGPEPWRHGVQVFTAPCKIDADTPSSTASAIGNERDLLVADWTNADDHNHRDNTVQVTKAVGRGTRSSLSSQAVRRIRHAELLLVDDVCIAHDRFWLRLRWPGRKGGFAGYIAMGLVSEASRFLSSYESHSFHGMYGILPADDNVTGDDLDHDENREETGSMPPSEPSEITSLVCSRTGLMFPSSPAMKLLGHYDDGLSPPVVLEPTPSESVFCRICREGLHDDADDELPAAADDDAEVGRPGSGPIIQTGSETGSVDTDDFVSNNPKGPASPHPTYGSNQDAMQNPMLAPCECSGSMAFVHYLCVEQWRCRSRHPDAHQGLNCETCGGTYALPPPAEREVHVHHVDQDQDDWLEAMPPHVMQALRQPHIWWQMGAAIVRRRWLRPIAPVIMSPVVALYCRARRMLKKRGVARRRWACSLCRRRARWKCVRCLRSYYCSRQCQNVSWHIIHKHVCYKPIRFWWSVVIYTIAGLVLFPGVRRDPLVYDLGLFALPLSFVVAGILGGSANVIIKKASGVDARGRILELSVVISTILLAVITWGLIQSFFGNSDACYGVIGAYNITTNDLASTSSMLKWFQKLVLIPMKAVYLIIDKVCLQYSGAWGRRLLCDQRSLAHFFPLVDKSEFIRNDRAGCFEHIPFANEDFFLQENGGEKCAADLVLVLSLYHLAAVSYIISAVAKHEERRQRRERLERRIPRQVRGIIRLPGQHPHED